MQDTVLAQYRREFRYFTISGWNAEEMRRLNLDAEIIHCGIDRGVFRELEGETRETRVILANARANPLKNFQMTLDAWKSLPESERPMFWMYGNEPELAEGLRPTRYFDRPTDTEINGLLNRATVFILTSRHEGFALTILEAMAAGAPVICTDADGNRDFCVDGENCLIVPQENSEALRKALLKLLDSPELQQQLRKGGLRTAAQYDWEIQVRKLQDFFRKISHPSASQ
jgi:glycosyltransferase involved in cell wall biosynthesis